MMQTLRHLFLALCGLAFAGLAWADTPAEQGPEASVRETAETSPSEAAAAEGAAEDAATEQGPAEDPTALYDKTIRWATASEVDNFGYDIYRGESPEGPFERLTEDPIAGAGTTDEPSYYTYVDEGLDPSKDYYYYIESISMFGQRERFTPVQKVPARHPGTEPDDARDSSEEADSPEEADSSSGAQGSEEPED